MVETALILPFVILIIFAIFEFGRIFNANLVITSASREGARVASVSSNDADVVNAVTRAASTLDASVLRISVLPLGADRRQGDQVTVQIDYSVDIIAPVISAIIPDPFNMSSQTVMRIE